MERYSVIVAELRRRIESGELPPGAKVPSTREIVRERGVAMATATKVLAELRRLGLVRAVPGVGTVVEGPTAPTAPALPTASASLARSDQPAAAAPSSASAPPTAPEPPAAPPARRRGAAEAPLALGRIVTAAVAVADAEGLAAVSMRRVAAELGVATMSLYRHVADKDDLLMRMMDAAFAESPLPLDAPDAPEGWRERLALAGRLLWAMFRRHPWLAAALSVSRPQPVASAMPLTEWVLATLTDRGLDPSTALTAHITLFGHVRGTALSLEMESQAEEDTGLDSEEWMEAQEPVLHAIMASGAFPVLQRVMTEGYDYDLDGVFEFGLQRLLDGLGVLLGDTG